MIGGVGGQYFNVNGKIEGQEKKMVDLFKGLTSKKEIKDSLDAFKEGLNYSQKDLKTIIDWCDRGIAKLKGGNSKLEKMFQELKDETTVAQNTKQVEDVKKEVKVEKDGKTSVGEKKLYSALAKTAKGLSKIALEKLSKGEKMNKAEYEAVRNYMGQQSQAALGKGDAQNVKLFITLAADIIKIHGKEHGDDTRVGFEHTVKEDGKTVKQERFVE